MSISHVSVLMSTYNGARYVREQIESILNQKGVEVYLLIRDDGSTDDTVSICREFEKKYDNVSVYDGENIGVGKSFMDLLKNAPEAEYYAFSDQDDVWLEEKLVRAVSIIQQVESKDLSGDIGKGYPITTDVLEKRSARSDTTVPPVLYGSNMIRVSETLQVKEERFCSSPACDILSCITRNLIYGCTMVMNYNLKEKCIEIGNPSDVVFNRKNHDGWILCLSHINGLFVYDNQSLIFYREHTDQVVGIKELKGTKQVYDRIRRLMEAKNKGVRSALANDLLLKASEAMDPQIEGHLRILKNANTFIGAIHLIKDKDLVASFGESKMMILVRGLLRWI